MRCVYQAKLATVVDKTDFNQYYLQLDDGSFVYAYYDEVELLSTSE